MLEGIIEGSIKNRPADGIRGEPHRIFVAPYREFHHEEHKRLYPFVFFVFFVVKQVARIDVLTPAA